MTLGGPAEQQPARLPLLAVRDLVVRYGSAQVLHGVDLHVDQGEVIGVLGSNGAGKSTLLRAISGLTRPSRGHVEFDGRDVAGRSPSHIVRAGISQVAEGRRIFRQQSVGANLELGSYSRKASRQQLAADLERVLSLFPVLSKKRTYDAAMLSGGEQQMLAIGQALMAAPRLLLMDEPSQGLAPIVIGNVIEKVRELRDAGLTVLIVEQQVALAQALCDRLYFLRNGVIVIDGVPPSELDWDDMRAAYV